MATISLNYDARNNTAKKAIDFLLSLGIFHEVEPMSKAEKKTRKAIQEIEEGKGTRCHSFEEYLKAIE